MPSVTCKKCKKKFTHPTLGKCNSAIKMHTMRVHTRKGKKAPYAAAQAKKNKRIVKTTVVEEPDLVVDTLCDVVARLLVALTKGKS